MDRRSAGQNKGCSQRMLDRRSIGQKEFRIGGVSDSAWVRQKECRTRKNAGQGKGWTEGAPDRTQWDRDEETWNRRLLDSASARLDEQWETGCGRQDGRQDAGDRMWDVDRMP